MKTRNLLLAAIAILLVGSPLTRAAVAPLPQIQVAPHWTTLDNLGYQGYATNSSGSPVADGSHVFDFQIFDHPTSPSPVLWAETQTLSTTSGRFSANLGEVVPLPIDLFGTPDSDTLRQLYLQVSIDTEPILPRTLLTAVPTARVSERVLGDIETELMAMRLRSPSGWVPFEIRSTDSGTTTFQVDSFFDIDYRIEWVSHPYEALVGLYGTGTSTQGRVEMKAADSAATVNLGIEHEDIGARLHTSDDGSGASLHLFDTPGSDSVDIDLRANSSGGRLTVSNIGSSGQDGVSIDVGEDLSQLLFVRQPPSQPVDSPFVLRSTSTETGMLTVDSFFDIEYRMYRVVDATGILDESTARNSGGFGGTVRSSATESEGRLTVSNIGSSGEDGVEIVVPTAAPEIHIFDSTGGLHARQSSSSLRFIDVLGSDSAIFARDRVKLCDLVSGTDLIQVEIKPLELVASSVNSIGDEHVVRLNGGGGGGGRISLEEKPAGATVPIEIVALSLVASEPILVTRPPTATPTSAPSMDMDYDASYRLIQTFRPPSGSSLDSVRLHGEGLEMHGSTHRYYYDSQGLRYVTSTGAIQRAAISPNGDMNMAGNALLATEPTTVCGIGSFDPAFKLFVNGDFCATGVTCPSDIRLKENVETIGSAVELIGQLRGVSFEWKSEEFPDRNLSEKHQIGFIAQEVAAVLPEVVTESSDGYLGVDYAKLTPVLVEAVKEQQKQIDQQRSTISQMQSKLERLERLIEQLASENSSQKKLDYASNE